MVQNVGKTSRSWDLRQLFDGVHYSFRRIPSNISGSFCIFFNTKAASLQPMILMDPVNCNMLDAEAFMVINHEGEHLGILLGVRRKMEGRPTLDIVGIEVHMQVG